MDASDAEVQRALVVGDYPGAVAACVAAGRHADALVLASVGGTELWEKTRAAHIAANISRPYMRVASAVVAEDLGAIVKSRVLAKWRETLAILCTYAPAEEWGALAGVLAGRLADAGDAHAATLCHICAGDVDAAVRHWMDALPSGKVSPTALHSVLEKAVVLTRATGQASSPGLANLAVSYAELLASQGQLTSAITYLDMVSDGGEAVTTLRDRIVRGGAGKLASSGAPRPPPPRRHTPPPRRPTPPRPRAAAVADAEPVRRLRGAQTQSAYGSQQPQQSAYGGGAYGQSQQSAGSSPYGGAPSLPPAPAQSGYDAYGTQHPFSRRTASVASVRTPPRGRARGPAPTAGFLPRRRRRRAAGARTAPRRR